MSRNPVVPTVVFIAGSLLLLPACFAQVVTATLTGSITDSSGGSVPNASVKVTERSTGTVRSTKTSMDGVYNVPYLNPGVYRVEVEASGFKNYSQDNVRLDVSTTARLDATMTPGSASETITVTAETPALQTDRAEVAKNFTTQAVAELPVANRNFQALAGLVAGVAPPVQNFTTSEDPQGLRSSTRTGRATRLITPSSMASTTPIPRSV